MCASARECQMLTSLTLSLSPSILPLSRVNSLDSMRREEGSEPGTLNMIGHCVDRAAHHGTCGGGGGGGRGGGGGQRPGASLDLQHPQVG